MDLLTEAKKIIEIDSTPYKSNKPVVDFLSSLLTPLNFDIELQEGSLFNNPQFNLIATKGPKEPGGLLLNTHVDTVSPGDFSLWDKTGGNPFRATVHEDKIFGLGVADVKLDVICKIKALEKFKDATLKKPLTLVATYGEESGLVGAKQLLKEKKVNPKYVLVGEASNLSIVYAHKGHMALEITLTDPQAKQMTLEKCTRIDFEGKAAHSSTPQLGINAVQNALSFLKENNEHCRLLSLSGGELINIIPNHATARVQTNQKLDDTHKDITVCDEHAQTKSFVFSDNFLKTLKEVQSFFKKLSTHFHKTTMAEFDPPYSLVNITKATTQNNQVILEVGIRTLPQLNTNELFSSIQTSIDAIQTKSAPIEIYLKRMRESYAMMSNPKGKLVSEARNCLRSLGMQDTVITKAGATEACLYERTGAEVIVWGPGVALDNIHKPNEYNYLHHLTQAVKFYEKMIESFCIKGI